TSLLPSGLFLIAAPAFHSSHSVRLATPESKLDGGSFLLLTAFRPGNMPPEVVACACAKPGKNPVEPGLIDAEGRREALDPQFLPESLSEQVARDNAQGVAEIPRKKVHRCPRFQAVQPVQ